MVGVGVMQQGVDKYLVEKHEGLALKLTLTCPLSGVHTLHIMITPNSLKARIGS